MDTENTPTWDDLAENDRARVVYFGRTVEGEGYGYAHENYSVEGHYEAPGLDDQSAFDLYRQHANHLDLGEWWRLYEMGEALPH